MSNNDLNFKDIYDFARFFCQEDMTCAIPEFHHELYELAGAGHKRIVVIAPRSFAKSTVFSKVYPLWQILEGNIKKILLVSATGELAEEMLSWIRNNLEDNKFITSYYGGKQGNKWTQDVIEYIRKDGSKVKVMANGAGKQIRGFRPDLIIGDDLDTDEGVLSSDRRAKLLDWFNKAVINTLESDSQMVLVGTLLHPLSLLANISGREGYIVRKYQAICPNGDSLWPEKWPIDRLLERKSEIGKDAFNSEYQNEPIVSDNPIFSRETFCEYDSGSKSFEEIVKEGVYTVTSIDPAISRKETADYSAIVSVSATYDDKPKFYVRVDGCARGHWPLRNQINRLDDIYRQVNSNMILIETVAYQQALADEFRLYQEEQHRYPKIKEFKPDRDKERRANAITGPFTDRQVYFDHTDPLTQRLMDELFLFPTGDHDDLVDAFVYCMSELMKWAKRRRMARENGKPQIILPKGQYRRTGYR